MHVLGKKRSKISWLRFYLTKLEKEKQIKSKVSRENKWEEINKIENRKAIGNINETKVWFFKKINEIDWTLVRLSIKKKEQGHKSLRLEMKEKTLLQSYGH